MAERTPVGRYASEHPPLEARLVTVGARDWDVRVQTDAFPTLSTWLGAILPEELHLAASAVALGSKHALPALSGMRGGWLLDAGGPTYTLWSQEADRAVQGDVRVLRAALELYARAVLRPFDGLLSAPPGAALDGHAPAWVDLLRQAEVALLASMHRVGQPLLDHSPAP
ncbi:MAG: hypothetical protein H6737_23230 [Alphaproteobacteria bacterium]|nr:hypothetical protein [Alphaproteobacteria bacterium]